MMNLTSQDKNLYNTYLHKVRTLNDKPFTPRKDFTNLNEEDILHIKRISVLLNKHPHIDPSIYFSAPFEVYEDKTFFDLKYFASMSGVKAYTVFMKILKEKDPDTPEQLEFIRRSLKFIGSFCIKNKISVDEYLKHKTGITYDWMKHVKNHQVSIYALLDFSDILDIITSTPEDERELFLGDIQNSFYTYKGRYLKSKKAKNLTIQGINKIRKITE